MHPLSYATKSTPAATRVGVYVAQASELAWLFTLLHKHPTAEAALVGDVVRDNILGRVPASTSVVIRGTDERTLNKFLGKHGDLHDVRDGRWTFSPQKNLVLDVRHPRRAVAHSRNQATYPDAQASFTDDLAQADFTANALAYNIGEGQLIDPYGGFQDLHAHTLRTVHDPIAHFGSNPLSIARALRLAAEHHLTIDRSTWQALLAHVPYLNRTVIGEDGRAEFAISRSVLGHEFLGSLTTHPSYGLELWIESRALPLVAPELSELGATIDDRGQSSLQKARELLRTLEGDAFRHLHNHPVNATTVLAGLLAHLKDARQALRSLTSRLHLHRSLEAIDFSHTDADWILEHLTYLDENDPAVLSTHQKNKLFGHDRGATLLAIVHALHLVNDTHTPARERLHTARQSRAGKNLTPLPHLIRGRDLAAVGVTPGPLYRLLFKKIRDAQLSGDIATKKQAHELVQQILQAQQTM